MDAGDGFAKAGGGLVGGGLEGGKGSGAPDISEGGGDGLAVGIEGLIEGREDVLVEGDVEAVAVCDEALGGTGDGV